MKRHTVLLLVSLLITTVVFAQGGGQPINIPIPIPTFSPGYGSSLVKDLGITPSKLQENPPGYTVDGLFTLTLPAVNNFPTYPGYYKMKVSFGTQELCESAGWAIRNPAQLVIVCGSPGYLIVDQSLDCDQNPCIVGDSVQGKQNLVLAVTVNGWTVNFKNATLTFTPIN